MRINPGQLSQGTTPGTQDRFDELMNSRIACGVPVWSSPGVQTQMGAKDALVMIKARIRYACCYNRFARDVCVSSSSRLAALLFYESSTAVVVAMACHPPMIAPMIAPSDCSQRLLPAIAPMIAPSDCSQRLLPAIAPAQLNTHRSSLAD